MRSIQAVTVLLVCSAAVVSLASLRPSSQEPSAPTLAERVENLEREVRVPVGSVVAYAGRKSTIPEGWRICNGDLIKPTDLNPKQYQVLFQAISWSYGQAEGVKDGSAGIRLPDYRGFFLRGVDRPKEDLKPKDRPRDAGPRKAAPGWSDDLVGTFEAYSTARPQSTKFFTGSYNQKDGPIRLSFQGSTESGGQGQYFSNSTNSSGSFSPTVTLPDHWHAIESGGDDETRPMNAAVYWIIRVY